MIAKVSAMIASIAAMIASIAAIASMISSMIAAIFSMIAAMIDAMIAAIASVIAAMDAETDAAMVAAMVSAMVSHTEAKSGTRKTQPKRDKTGATVAVGVGAAQGLNGKKSESVNESGGRPGIVVTLEPIRMMRITVTLIINITVGRGASGAETISGTRIVLGIRIL